MVQLEVPASKAQGKRFRIAKPITIGSDAAC